MEVLRGAVGLRLCPLDPPYESWRVQIEGPKLLTSVATGVTRAQTSWCEKRLIMRRLFLRRFGGALRDQVAERLLLRLHLLKGCLQHLETFGLLRHNAVELRNQLLLVRETDFQLHNPLV